MLPRAISSGRVELCSFKPIIGIDDHLQIFGIAGHRIRHGCAVQRVAVAVGMEQVRFRLLGASEHSPIVWVAPQVSECLVLGVPRQLVRTIEVLR